MVDKKSIVHPTTDVARCARESRTWPAPTNDRAISIALSLANKSPNPAGHDLPRLLRSPGDLALLSVTDSEIFQWTVSSCSNWSTA
jgi:hypothetical protein